MKTFLSMAMAVLLAGVVRAQDAAPQSAAQLAAQAAAAKVLVIPDNAKAAEALAAKIRELLKDEQAVKDGVPELTIAALVKSDPQRAMHIMPLFLNAATEFAPLDLFQRLMAASLLATGDEADALTQAILDALAGKARWLAAAMDVAKDSNRPLPIALRTAIQIIPAVTLPPVVIPPLYEGQ